LAVVEKDAATCFREVIAVKQTTSYIKLTPTFCEH
jgi:hypothetical protein